MAHASPEHYGSNWNVGDFIREQGLSFHLGNAIKYICRCGKKPTADPIDDLNKAISYLENERDFLRSCRESIPQGVPTAARIDDFFFATATEFDR